MEFHEEPRWFEYERDGKTYRTYANIDDIDIYRMDISQSIPITSREYDAEANKVTFRFEPIPASDKEQTIILQLGYIESTHLSYAVLTIPAE